MPSARQLPERFTHGLIAPKLIALDLDGTTLDPSGRPSPATIAAIHRVVTSGIKVVFATGRTYAESRAILRTIGHTPRSVFVGGAHVVDTATGRSLHTHPFTPDIARRLVAHVASLGHASLALQDTDKGGGRDYWVSHHAPLHQETLDWFKAHSAVWDVHPDLAAADHAHTIRIGVVDTTDAITRAYASVKEKFSAELNSHTLRLGEGVSVLECHDIRVTKWLGISQLAADWNIPAADIIGIGDENNDLPMFRSVGLAVAMGNAKPHVKDAAHLVIGDNGSDGLAHFLNDIVDGKVLLSPTG